MNTYEHDPIAPKSILESGVEAGPLISRRRLSNAHRAEMMFLRSLSQLEAAVDRRHSAVAVTIDNLPMDDCVLTEVQRAVCRALFQRLKYWEFWFTRYCNLEQHEKDRLQRVYFDFHQFAGDGT